MGEAFPDSRPGPRRIAVVTAGAGGMYCGSCLRDDALARALRRRGVDACVFPTYAPPRLEGPDKTPERIFLGGIHIYLGARLGRTVRLPGWLDRALSHPRLLRLLTARPRTLDPRRLGDLTLSMLAGPDGPHRDQIEALAEALAGEAPDVVELSNLLIGGVLPALREATHAALVVDLKGDDLFLEKLPRSYPSRVLARLRELARIPDLWTVPSQDYGRKMGDLLGIDPDRIAHVPLGIDWPEDEGADATVSRREGDGAVVSASGPAIVYCARLCREKGFGAFVELLARLRQRKGCANLRGIAIGSWGDEGHAYITALRRRARRLLGDRRALEIHVGVDRERKWALLRSAACLCVPAPYAEPKGLYVLEALAAGTPVVVPAHGAFPELLQELGGGLLFPPGDLEAAADRIAELLGNPERRDRLAREGQEAVRRRRTSDRMAEAALAAYSRAIAACGRRAAEPAPAPENRPPSC